MFMTHKPFIIHATTKKGQRSGLATVKMGCLSRPGNVSTLWYLNVGTVAKTMFFSPFVKARV